LHRPHPIPRHAPVARRMVDQFELRIADVIVDGLRHPDRHEIESLFVCQSADLERRVHRIVSADIEKIPDMMRLHDINDPREISVLRDELFLGVETIDRVLLTDVLNDGFDENDMVQLYPSGRVLKLAPITPRLDSLLRSYRLPPNVEIHDTRQYFARYDSVSRERVGGQALGYGLLGGAAERLQQGYRGDTLEAYLRFSHAGVSVLAWNFDSSRIAFPRFAEHRVDTVFIFQHDTIRVPEVITVTTEPIIIRDTVYIPSELLRNARGTFYRVALGMIGGGYSMANRKASRGRVTLGAGNEWDFGVWDPWISGRQDIRARIGLRFLTDMAPWKTDTLSPRFLGSSFEAMFIPAWDRSLFLFAGLRAFFDDDLFWDRARAAWNEDLYHEAATQDLQQYEMTVKAGLDKFTSFGAGKRFGAWLKVSGWIPGGSNSGYDLDLQPQLTTAHFPNNEIVPWHFEHGGGNEVEAALTARLGDVAQMMVSFGQVNIANLHYSYIDSSNTPQPPAPYVPTVGLLRATQIYQTVAVRVAPINQTDMRLMFEAGFRNNSLAEKIKQGHDATLLKEWFFPYLEAPELNGTLQLDFNILRFRAGARYFFPPKSKDAQLRPEASLHLLFK